MSNTIVLTFGTFDVFHVGHLSILNRAKSFGDTLIVGVSSDKLNYSKKNRYPVFNQQERIEIVSNIRCVDSVFLEESLALKAEYIQQYSASILIMGDDWKGKFDEHSNLCEVLYLSRTPSISTTAVIEKISSFS